MACGNGFFLSEPYYPYKSLWGIIILLIITKPSCPYKVLFFSKWHLNQSGLIMAYLALWPNLYFSNKCPNPHWTGLQTVYIHGQLGSAIGRWQLCSDMYNSEIQSKPPSTCALTWLIHHNNALSFYYHCAFGPTVITSSSPQSSIWLVSCPHWTWDLITRLQQLLLWRRRLWGAHTIHMPELACAQVHFNIHQNWWMDPLLGCNLHLCHYVNCWGCMCCGQSWECWATMVTALLICLALLQKSWLPWVSICSSMHTAFPLPWSTLSAFKMKSTSLCPYLFTLISPAKPPVWNPQTHTHHPMPRTWLLMVFWSQNHQVVSIWSSMHTECWCGLLSNCRW